MSEIMVAIGKLSDAATALAAFIFAMGTVATAVIAILAKLKLLKAAQVKKFNKCVAEGMSAGHAIQCTSLSVKEAVANPKIGFNKLEDFIIKEAKK
jgi:uncharacterized protein YoaH (UPF0181 family)